MTLVKEPLLESAALARRLAPQLCRRNPATGDNCSWLHGFWQCLRLMELAAAPDRHAAFYQRAFELVTGSGGPPRLLISGAADYSMLAHVIAAFRARGIEPAVTVIDVCGTGLFLNRWYAEHVACVIDTEQCSLLDFRPKAAFDAVCTHSFLGQVASEHRPGLVAAWQPLLRPGGLAITAHPLRPWGADEPNRFTPEQANAFRAAVHSKAPGLLAALGATTEEIMHQAERYLEARYGYPVRSGEEVRELFERAGFEVSHLACGPVAADVQTGAGGPGLRDNKVQYASVIAIRT